MLVIKEHDTFFIEDEQIFTSVLIGNKSFVFYPGSLKSLKRDLFELVCDMDFDFFEAPATLLYADGYTSYFKKDSFIKITIKRINEDYLFIATKTINATNEIIKNQYEVWDIIKASSKPHLYEPQEIPTSRKYFGNLNGTSESALTCLTLQSDFGLCTGQEAAIFNSENSFESFEKLQDMIWNLEQKQEFEEAVQLYLKLFNNHGVHVRSIDPFLKTFYQSKRGLTDFEKLGNDKKIGPFPFDYEHQYLESELWRSDVFTFGKHKSKTLGEVMINDPKYVLWCLKNIPTFYFTKDLFYPFNILEIPSAVDALEYYYAKEALIYATMEDFYETKQMIEESKIEDMKNGSGYSQDDIYRDAGGGNEWSDDTEFWS